MIENHMVLPVYEDPAPAEEVNDYLWWEDQFELMVQKQRMENERLEAEVAKLGAVIDKALDDDYISNAWLQEALEQANEQ